MFLCFMSQSQDPTDPIWQTANRKRALHRQNCPTSQMKVSRYPDKKY